MRSRRPNVGKADVDVIGPDGEYIAVGGPAKARNLGDFIKKTGILKWCADQKGVVAKVYLAEGSPQNLIEAASKVVGRENVIVFK